VLDLPQVPLNVPLPVPDTSPLPVAAKPVTTRAAATTATTAPGTHTAPTSSSTVKPAVATTPTTLPAAR